MGHSVTVARLQQERIGEACEVLRRAFWEDPLAVFLMPDEAHRRATIVPWFAGGVRYGHLFGEVYMTSPEVTGVAVWIPPDNGPMSEERFAAAGFGEVALALGEVGMGRFTRFLEHSELHHQAAMPEPHWYLMILGVTPERQGRGVGGQLLQPVLARADAEGTTCYLETGSDVLQCACARRPSVAHPPERRSGR